MSRFVLDCALSRPVDGEAAQWLATAAIRGFASTTAGYHEAKISQALLLEAGRSVAQSADGSSAIFLPDTLTAVRHATADLITRSRSPLVATGAADPLVLQDGSAQAARDQGVEHVVLAVDPMGRIRELPDRAVLVTSVGNQEIGSLQRDLSQWSRRSHSPLLFDASCALGWTPLPSHWDRLVLDPRAWGAPPGACVVVSPEQAGTEGFSNVAAAVTAGLTLQRWLQTPAQQRERVREQIHHIVDRVRHDVPDVEIHGGGPQDLPHILSLSVLYVDGEALAGALDASGYAVGSGSACASLTGQPSHVLSAIGGLTSGNVRLGLTPGLPDSVIEGFIDTFVRTVADIRDQLGSRNI